MSDEAPQPPAQPSSLSSGTMEDSQPPADSSTGNNQVQQVPDATEQPWYQVIKDPDLRGLVESRHWDSIDKVVKSYKDLEALRGVPAERLLQLPDDLQNSEAMGEIYGRLGRPMQADDYQIEGIDAEHDISWFKELMHDSGVSQVNAQKISDALRAQAEQVGEEQNAQFAQQAQIDMGDLQKEWGAAYDRRVAAGKAIVQKLGFSDQQLQGIERAIGTKEFMAKFAAMGEMVGEAAAPDDSGREGGGGGFEGMSPEAAKAAYESLNADPDFKARLFSDDKRVREKAMAERNRLSRLAFDQG